MTVYFSIKPSAVHLWRIWIPEWVSEIPVLQALLSEDELERARRFRFAVHRERFIVARAFLRKILHLYTEISPEKLVFDYAPRGKPFLRDCPTKLYFNLSHSSDIAVYALTSCGEIGVDIEKIEPEFKVDVARRFFSEKEVRELEALPSENRHIGFYRIWSRKEALIKALGEGLFAPLNEFSVSPVEDIEKLVMLHDEKKTDYFIENFLAHPDYASAFAITQKIASTVSWQWLPSGPIKVT